MDDTSQKALNQADINYCIYACHHIYQELNIMKARVSEEDYDGKKPIIDKLTKVRQNLNKTFERINQINSIINENMLRKQAGDRNNLVIPDDFTFPH